MAALEDLSPARVQRWQDAYERTGVRVQQSPAYARALSAAGSRILVATGDDVVAAFTRGPAMCSAVGADEPLLGTTEPCAARLVPVVAAVRRATGLPVYLPLVDDRYAEVSGHGEFACWDRPPNSLIDWTRQGLDLRDRVRERGTSQPDRKRRLVERDGLVLDHGTTGEAAARDMLAVDDRSWKAARGQSMRERGDQAALYGGLVRDGVVGVTFLRDGGAPVAFRLDSRAGDRLTCLKWSYDESYRRYSPGLYLLTEGLVRQWGDRGLRVVDLFGGPDTVKDLLHTHRVPRIDVWCGDPELGAAQARDRRALDERTGRARDGGRGLRHAFE
ncbi:GNAT family N-acetyltransferase [Actinocorallia herbida]|uniref:GNAT family N-acetyltransferase n=1 Tax=Actinocorallia herbida TaxID=58109 RepID=UPI00147729A9|nr:GNAT family N-acetyltransferase [Actinocorallia herbida]